MNHLVVVAFDQLDDARSALRRLRQLEHEGQIHFEDTAIVECDADGKAHVKNEVSGATETGGAAGAILGGIFAVIFPVVGIAVGAAAGALVGRAMDTGVSGKFVKEVKDSLQPGRSALFLVIKQGYPGAISTALRDYHGEIIQTTFEPEAEESLKAALK